MHFALPAALATTLFVLGCAIPAKEEAKPKDPGPPAPKLVGRVASIPADRQFVLVQSYGPWEVPAGSILTTRGPAERTANLKATGETLGQFAAADLQAGTLEIGDAVYLQPATPLPTPPESTPPLPSDSPVGSQTTRPENN